MKETGTAICATAALALLIFAAALPTAIALEGTDAESAWPSWRGNGKNTGLSPYATDGVDGTLRWAVHLPSRARASPVVGADGTVCVSTVGHWDPDNVHAPPIFSPGLYALGPDGAVRWNQTLIEDANTHYITGMAARPDGSAYYVPYGRELIAMARDGTRLWSASIPAAISAPALSPSGTVLVGCWDGLYALGANGTMLWNFTTRYPVCSSPATDDDGTIYFVDNNYKLYALSPGGQPKWFASIRGFDWNSEFSCLSSPAVGADGTVYVGSPDGNLYAINRQGLQRWKYKTGKAIYSSPAIGPDGTVYIGSSDDRLYAISAGGQLKWLFAAGNNIESSPAIGADGTVYVGATSRYGWASSEMMAFSPGGNVKWRRNVSGSISSSPAIGADGTVYVASSQMLYAFGSTPLSYRMNMIYAVLAAAFAIAAAAYCARRFIPWEDPKK